MCALTPFPTTNWPLVNPIGSYEQNCMYANSETIESLFLDHHQLRPPPTQEGTLFDHQSPSFTSCNPGMVKKLNHNASERDRRKKVNNLYSYLRSLLPVAYQRKKLSFPATVSHALKYIPELQNEVERLAQKKEKLLLRISQRRGLKLEEQQKKRSSGRYPGAAVSIKALTESEVAIQISFQKAHKKNLSEILQYLEQDGLFLLLNATSFESSGGMVFYNIHLQAKRSNNFNLESEALEQRILSLFDQ